MPEPPLRLGEYEPQDSGWISKDGNLAEGTPNSMAAPG